MQTASQRSSSEDLDSFTVQQVAAALERLSALAESIEGTLDCGDVLALIDDLDQVFGSATCWKGKAHSSRPPELNSEDMEIDRAWRTLRSTPRAVINSKGKFLS